MLLPPLSLPTASAPLPRNNTESMVLARICRQGLNNLQATHSGFGLVSQENVFKARLVSFRPQSSLR